MLNTCEAMREHFPHCLPEEKCSLSIGAEQPAYVDERAETRFFPGTCLVNSNPLHSSCDAHHPATLRLCACD